MKAIIQLGKRIGTGFLAVILLASMAVPAQAQTNTELESLLTQIAALQTTQSTTAYVFTRDLTIGSTGADVTALQQYLIKGGYTIPAGATGYFGAQTQGALAAFQRAKGIVPPAGYFGAITRAHVHANVGTPAPTPTPTPGDDDDFFGGTDEGYLDEFDQIGSLSNEEVGEDEEVDVLGVEFTAEDADQMITRATVVIDAPTGNDDLEDLITEVAIYLNGDELDRMDVDDASYSRNADRYTFRFTNLEGILDEGDTGELTVAVVAANNIDSADEGDGWTVTIPEDGIRAVSPNGVDDTYDSSEYESDFTVESFASANDIELDITAGEDNPEEGVVSVEDEGDEIVLLEFELEANGSDLMIFGLPFLITTSGANVEDVIDELILEVDGDEESENLADNNATTQTVSFDDLEIMIDEGDSMTFRLIGISATSSPMNGLTIAADLTESGIDAEDQSGDNLASGDISGTANGDTQHIFEIAPEIEVTSATISPISNGDEPAESALARITVELTARGGDIYLNGDDELTAADEFFVLAALGGNASTTITSSTHAVTGSYTVVNQGTDDEYYVVREDRTIKIEITAIVNQAAVTSSALLVGVQGTAIQFGVDDTNQTTRSAFELNWSDLIDELKTPRAALVNPS